MNVCICACVYVEIILVTNAAAADVVSTAITVLLPSNLMQKINSAKWTKPEKNSTLPRIWSNMETFVWIREKNTQKESEREWERMRKAARISCKNLI